MKTLILLALTFLAFAFVGCKTTSVTKQAGLYYGGYKAASKAIEHHEGNRETVATIADTIDIVLEEDELLFSVVETWYAKEKSKLRLDPIDQEFIDMLIVRPLWAKLKSKYNGVSLSLDNPAVRADILSFQAGVRRALKSYAYQPIPDNSEVSDGGPRLPTG